MRELALICPILQSDTGAVGSTVKDQGEQGNTESKLAQGAPKEKQEEVVDIFDGANGNQVTNSVFCDIIS